MQPVPVAPAPLPPLRRPKPKPRGDKDKPLFVSVNSPQQLYMFHLTSASVAISRGHYGRARRSLDMARQYKNTAVLSCEYGYLFHRMALDTLRRGKKALVKKHLLKARTYYQQCKAKAPASEQKKRAAAGLRDIGRTLQLFK